MRISSYVSTHPKSFHPYFLKDEYRPFHEKGREIFRALFHANADVDVLQAAVLLSDHAVQHGDREHGVKA